MAMALGRLSRRLSASQAAGVTRRIGVPEMMTKTTIPQSPPPLPSLLPASPWISLPGPAAQLMGRAFSSPVAASAAARVRRRIPNLQGHQHLRVICRGTDGMLWEGKKRFSVGAKANEPARYVVSIKKLLSWLDKQANPRNFTIFFAIINVIYLGWFVKACLKSDEHSNDCTINDPNYRSAEHGCKDPFACPWYRALVVQYAVLLVVFFLK